jgi:hypothetical protein
MWNVLGVFYSAKIASFLSVGQLNIRERLYPFESHMGFEPAVRMFEWSATQSTLDHLVFVEGIFFYLQMETFVAR